MCNECPSLPCCDGIVVTSPLCCSVMHMLQKSSSACYTKGHAHYVDNWHGLSRESEGDGEAVVNRVCFSLIVLLVWLQCSASMTPGSVIAALVGLHGGKQLCCQQGTSNHSSTFHTCWTPANTVPFILKPPLTRQGAEHKKHLVYCVALP